MRTVVRERIDATFQNACCSFHATRRGDDISRARRRAKLARSMNPVRARIGIPRQMRSIESQLSSNSQSRSKHIRQME